MNQNAINLTNIQLSQHQQSLSKKDPSFTPTLKDVNWFNLRQDTNQLRTKFNQAIDRSTEKKKAETSTSIIVVAIAIIKIIAIIMNKC